MGISSCASVKLNIETAERGARSGAQATGSRSVGCKRGFLNMVSSTCAWEDTQATEIFFQVERKSVLLSLLCYRPKSAAHKHWGTKKCKQSLWTLEAAFTAVKSAAR